MHTPTRTTDLLMIAAMPPGFQPTAQPADTAIVAAKPHSHQLESCKIMKVQVFCTHYVNDSGMKKQQII